jgi:hypothetical protein
MKDKLFNGAAFAIVSLAAASAFLLPSQPRAAEETSLLSGKVTSSTGEVLAGIPIKARRAGSTMTVAVYSNAKGEYSFPSWSDVTPGSYAVTVELPDFEHVNKDGVSIASGKTAKVDLTLKSKPVAYSDATASEIIAALPGTDHQKVLFSQCSNCHSLQWALRTPRSKDEWAKIVKRMGGRASEAVTPDTYAFSQKQFIDPLAEYLASIRGPDSKSVPFKPRPRPTEEASTNLVVTEYDLPRGGAREVYMLRGDPRFVWPHDVIMDREFAYYTDHFSYVLGRIDIKTGEAKEMPFPLPEGAGREAMGAGDGRPGNPGGGAHELQFDHKGNVIVGMNNGTVKYDPGTAKSPLGGRRCHVRFDPEAMLETVQKNGELFRAGDGRRSAQTHDLSDPMKNSASTDIDHDPKGHRPLIWRGS